ncbi:MAG: antibiotic biosynthesis monooxygenase [Desulfobacula sp.]|jgi:heme-degrading monooxygenase HmoA|uniref:antibiotic biosynthesis monooxygenase family protein n=1 Tax=Desulfobacula sp. TaxID=2593537 RepID=UPI001DEE2FFE|nr:antibiotic biosynthesis monooxygenase [Desulfobacula sp.]MBT3484479.1 antibiotic biosynthesis monooxygenase [Desulfobacula sp.]MBT3803117.1 antibiotic biosynthesis monooxygenase [Desulfobacula sp.]MBT4024687.1 antibiotic biosynthesis monooxygenase [Desulfobacula sp.]MBT4197165.1 antibiotic biosynthesis monooxygenase [Desulfobacula sp.]
MIVKVIIKRDVADGMEKDFFSQLKNLRFNAMDQKGYISGETLICAENTNKVVVISKWETLKDWNNWKNNDQRIEIDARLNELQVNPTIYEPYVFSKYKVAAEQGFPLPLQNQQL